MIGRLLGASMRRPRHHTLIFHRVMYEQDPMSPGEPTADWFRALIRMLAANFEIISLSDALARARDRRLNGRSVSITFDDGYADNYTVALPILEAFNAPATFFIASGFLDGGRMWNDSLIEAVRRLPDGLYQVDDDDVVDFELNDWSSRRNAANALIKAWKHLSPEVRQQKVDAFAAQVHDLPTDLMMSSEQLAAMAASPQATIGGHTVSHPILASLPADQAQAEIASGKAAVEEKIQRELRLFAYPNGKLGNDYRREHAELVRKAGFDAAVATDWGTMDASTDPFAIPRFTPWQTNLTRFSIDLWRCHYGLM